MRFSRALCAAVLAVAITVPSAFAQEKLSLSPNKLSRTTPVTEAVKKTKPGVVAIRIPRPGERDIVGAGIIVDESGVIVTNRHVTAGKKQVRVRLDDGTDLTGDVVMADADVDLAVVRIKTSKSSSLSRLARPTSWKAKPSSPSAAPTATTPRFRAASSAPSIAKSPCPTMPLSPA